MLNQVCKKLLEDMFAGQYFYARGKSESSEQLPELSITFYYRMLRANGDFHFDHMTLMGEIRIFIDFIIFVFDC